MEPVRIVVTGAGSGVGNGVVKALRLSGLPLTIICTDIGPLNAGLYRADEAILWPPVEKTGALEQIVADIDSHNIDAVLIGSEFDLAFFAAHRDTIEWETGCKVVVSPPDVISIADDKWETFRFLKRNSLPRPETHLPKNIDDALAAAADIRYPVIVKPRRGTSARGVHVAENDKSLRACFQPNGNQIVQEYLEPAGSAFSGEFTCSVFRLGDGRLIGPCTARRTLRGGDSWAIEVDAFEDLHPLLRNIGEALPAMGALNVQLMETDRGAVPFEINARFSGTTAIRAHFGFNEPEMAVRHYVFGQPIAQPDIGRGMALRYMEEVYLDGRLAAELSPPLPRGTIERWF